MLQPRPAYPLQEMLAYRQSVREHGLAVAPQHRADPSRNRSESTVVVPAQRRNDALAHFFGAKIGEALTGFGLGYVVGMGEPMFMTDPANPQAGFGLVPVVAVASNLFELVMIWTGWTPSRKIGGLAGLLVDGAARGVASTSNGIFWYNQGNMLALAKGGVGTPGVSTLGMAEYPALGGYQAPANGGALQMGYAPPAQNDAAPLHAPKVQAARAAVNDPYAFFF